MDAEGKLVCLQRGSHSFRSHALDGKCVNCGITFEAVQKGKELSLRNLQVNYVQHKPKKRFTKKAFDFRNARDTPQLSLFESKQGGFFGNLLMFFGFLFLVLIAAIGLLLLWVKYS